MNESPPRVVLDVPKTARVDGLLPVNQGMQSWRNQNGFVVLTVPYHSDPEKDNWTWYDMAKMGLRDDQFNQEVLIDFTARGGQKVFPYLDKFKNKYLVKPWAEIPRNYTIIAGLDFGSRNPTAILFAAVSERGHVHIFSEYYEPSNPAKIARYLKSHPYIHRTLKISADPSIWKNDQHDERGETIRSVADMLTDLGVHIHEKANNDRLAGLERVKHMFRHSDDNPGLQPYMTISSDCRELWKELTTIVYKEENPTQLVNKNQSEDTVKKKDHAFDALKYLLLSWGVPSDGMDKPRPDENSLDAVCEEMDRRREEEEDRMENFL